MAALDFPNSPTNGQQYSAPNGVIYTYDGVAWTTSGVLSTGSAAGGDLTGTYPNPTIKPSALPWSVSGATLTPTDTTKSVTVQASGNALQWGARTAKARLYANAVADAVNNVTLGLNTGYGSASPDETTTASWLLRFRSGTFDDFTVLRAPATAGAPAFVEAMKLDSVGRLTMPGPTTAVTGADQATIVLGTRTVKGRLSALPGFDQVNLSVNRYFDGSAWQREDTGKIAWSFTLDSGGDNFYAQRTDAAGAQTTPFKCIGVGDLTILGNNATKNTGSAWINPSDPRLKQDVAPYAAGLAEIARLEPITYRLKAQPDGPLCYGFDAERVRDVFPECVSETSMKLDPTDEEETPGVLIFDMHPILVALVTAVKELTARVAALEAHA